MVEVGLSIKEIKNTISSPSTHLYPLIGHLQGKNVSSEEVSMI